MMVPLLRCFSKLDPSLTPTKMQLVSPTTIYNRDERMQSTTSNSVDFGSLHGVPSDVLRPVNHDSQPLVFVI